MRRFTTKNVKTCNKYVETLTNLIEEARLGDKVKEKCNGVQKYLDKLKEGKRSSGEDTQEEKKILHKIENELQKLHVKRCQLMKAAEKKCRKKKCKECTGTHLN